MRRARVTAEDRLNFIHLMTHATKSSEQEKRLDARLENLDISESRQFGGTTPVRNSSFEGNRKRHRPDVTANFFALMGAPSGLKFLTHDFDPNCETSMAMVIDNAIEIINSKEYGSAIPGSLIKLYRGFIDGDKWIDYKKTEHNFYLKSARMNDWIHRMPFLHPIVSEEFGSEINAFRNTVRISKPNLDSIFKHLLIGNPNLGNLRIHTDNLDKADFYTNVFWVTYTIFNKVLEDIAQRDATAKVDIAFNRTTWNEYRICNIRITHLGSEANPFYEAKRKLMSSGGALYNIMSSCTGYCDWTLEANFEGQYKRWRVLNFRELPEEEVLDATEVTGFTHIFSFYKK